MAFEDLPASAAWRHEQAREGFEAVFFRAEPPGWRIDGHTAAVEGAEVWAVRSTITVDGGWSTRTARVRGWSARGDHEVRLDTDGAGRWRVDGSPVEELDGCLDVDLESSAQTNALPVRRAGLAVGGWMDAPAAYIRAPDLRVERLEQAYGRLDDVGAHQRYEYRCPAFDVECLLVYDPSGLVLTYPGIATRAR